MPPSHRIEPETTGSSEPNEHQDFDDPPALTWSCVMGNETFQGETRIAMNVQYDQWFTQTGERKHAKYTGLMSQTDMSYETDASGWNRALTQRAIVQPDTEYKLFQGSYQAKPAEYSYRRQGDKIELSVDTDGATAVLKNGSKEYNEALAQMSRVNFDPPCPKPRS